MFDSGRLNARIDALESRVTDLEARLHASNSRNIWDDYVYSGSKPITTISLWNAIDLILGHLGLCIRATKEIPAHCTLKTTKQAALDAGYLHVAMDMAKPKKKGAK